MSESERSGSMWRAAVKGGPPSPATVTRLIELCARAMKAAGDNETRALAVADLTAALRPEDLMWMLRRWEDSEAMFRLARQFLGR